MQGFKSAMQQYVCSYDCYPDTDLYRHGSVGNEARGALNIREITGVSGGMIMEYYLTPPASGKNYVNPLMHPAGVMYFPRP